MSLPNPKFLNIIQGECALNGASKDSLSICEIRGSSNLSKYCLQIGSSKICFGFIQICVKTFKYVINCQKSMTVLLSSRAAAWTESTRSRVCFAAVAIASSSSLSSLTKLLVACMSSRSSRNAGISTESTASLTAEVTTESKVLFCSLNASLIPLAIASSRSSLEMVESLNFFFFGDCSICPFRSPLKNTLYEHIFCQAMLFLICFRKYKTTWNSQLGVTQYQLYQNFYQTLIFLASQPSFVFLTNCGFFISLFLICGYTWHIVLVDM